MRLTKRQYEALVRAASCHLDAMGDLAAEEPWDRRYWQAERRHLRRALEKVRELR